MNEFDILFRAFSEYKKITQLDRDLSKKRTLIGESDIKYDEFKSIKYTISISEDWLLEIEKNIKFLENAVNEERQFIRTNGEVVPIEKAKRISKSSVEHLSKHSNLITREPLDNQDIVPDKIYMVEKLSDYAVYENRFLYLLLIYMKDFINLRLNKIKETIKYFKYTFVQKKNIKFSEQTIKYKIDIENENLNNIYYIQDQKLENIVNRITTISRTCDILLSTDLMKQVSLAPVIKPPIVKTNVLKMNTNFKACVYLYEYLVNYSGDGYKIEKKESKYTPLNNIISDDLSEVVLFYNFLLNMYSLSIKDNLKLNYNEFIKKQEEENQKKLLEQIERQKKNISLRYENVLDYAIMLEERIKYLEKENLNIGFLNSKIKELTDQNHLLNSHILDLTEDVSKLHDIIEQNYIKFQEDIEIAVSNTIEKKDEEIKEIKSDYDLKISLLNDTILDKDNSYNMLVENHKQNIDILNNKINEINIEKNSIISDKIKLEENLLSKINDLDDNVCKYKSIIESKMLLENNTSDIDDYFLTEEGFTQLERQEAALKKFVKQQWAKAKKHIRKTYLWSSSKEQIRQIKEEKRQKKLKKKNKE